MIRPFCHEGLINEVDVLFVEMKDCNCLPNDTTCNTLIRDNFSNKMYSEASKFIDNLRAHGILEDASTMSLLSVLLELKEHDPALFALRRKYLT